jgi:streptomycin 6-kinase
VPRPREEPSDHVLHGDLHYGKALTDRARGGHLAQAVNGDPHFELAPILWHRWDEI